MADKKVTLYTQPGWMFCSMVKEFLSQKGVRYEERDVSTDDNALNELKKMGIMTTPVTVVNGEIITGFDMENLKRLTG